MWRGRVSEGAERRRAAQALLALLPTSLMLGSPGCASLLGVEEARCEAEGCPGVDDEPSDPDRPNGPSNPQDDAGASEAGTDEPRADAGEPEVDKAEICAAYCTLVSARCSAAAPQYQSQTGCEILCNAVLEPSANFYDENDRNDTIDCRQNFARAAAAGEVAENCEAAGLYGGGDVCGDRCQSYCGRMERFCPNQFAEFEDCPTECARVPEADEPFDIEQPSANTLSCRVYHLQLSVITADSELHCRHAAGKDDVCVDPE